MKPKSQTAARARAPSKPKSDPRQAELPNTQAEGETGSAASAPPKPPTLKLPEVLAELENAAKPLNVRVTYEAIGGELGAGGLCKVKGQWRVIIDKRTTASERVSVLASSLARFDFASVPLSPQVRELLLRVAPAPPPSPPSEDADLASAEPAPVTTAPAPVSDEPALASDEPALASDEPAPATDELALASDEPAAHAEAAPKTSELLDSSDRGRSAAAELA